MTMYRLLIVDDEEIIVNGLHEIFNSLKHLDLDVYKAYSGEEAIEWLNRTRIDIVLTDIRMPEIDGLQLLEVIRKSWPQCRVIFLTGYNEFEYVYKAIQHSGVQYILKTEDHDKVIEAVNNAISDIQKDMKIEDLVHKAKEQMNMALDLFQKDYLIHLLHEDTSLTISRSQFEHFGIPLQSDKPVILLVGQVDGIPDAGLNYWDKIQYLYSVKLIMAQYLSTKTRMVNIIDDAYKFVLFLQPKELLSDNTGDYYEKTVSFLKGMLEVIQSSCRESLNASVSFSLGGEPCEWKDISLKYYSLNQLLNFRLGSGIESILIDNEFGRNILSTDQVNETSENDADQDNTERLLRQSNLDTLELYLEAGQQDKYFKAFNEIVGPIRMIRNKQSSAAIEAYYKVALMLLSYINRWKLNKRMAVSKGQLRLMQLDYGIPWKDDIAYLQNISHEIFKLKNEEAKKRADNTIDFIRQYIQDHLSEDLSLVRLAEQVYLNPSYLSRFFKQEKGMNLSDYIDSSRAKKAKELLCKENMKIHEVARLVGYESAPSFTRFFRKITGLSPQEYHDSVVTGKEKLTM